MYRNGVPYATPTTRTSHSPAEWAWRPLSSRAEWAWRPLTRRVRPRAENPERDSSTGTLKRRTAPFKGMRLLCESVELGVFLLYISCVAATAPMQPNSKVTSDVRVSWYFSAPTKLIKLMRPPPPTTMLP